MKWQQLNTPKAIDEFMMLYGHFHDSCIKEIKYISGMFVDENLSMNPISSKKRLSVIFQRQFSNPTAVEIVFEGLIHLNLCPEEEGYTGEIFDAYMEIHDGTVYWAETADFDIPRIIQGKSLSDFTWIAAKRAKWRRADNLS